MTNRNFALLFFCFFLSAPLLSGQAGPQIQNTLVRPRITEAVDNSRRTVLAGNVRPFLHLATDEGELDGGTKTGAMMLMFARPAEKQAELDTLAEALHDPHSPQYHHWLTPVQFGASFSPADSDIEQVRAWMEAQGLQVLDIPRSKTFISFTATIAQLKSAFGLSMHRVLINGEHHAANLNDPTVPAAFAAVVGGIHGLDNFLPKPSHTEPVLVSMDRKTRKVTKKADAQADAVHPNFTADSGYYLVGPQDFYTIYNESPLLQAGITGAGQTVAMIEQTQVNPADVTSFRSLFGLPAYPSTPNATAGGVNYLYGSSGGLNGYASCYSPGTPANGDEGEADLDLQWAGTVAPQATIDFVACGGTATSPDGDSPGAQGVDHAAQYVVNYLQGSVVAASMSYGACEAGLSSSSTSGVGYYNNQWQQFAVEGITAIVPTGDTGSENCNFDRKYAQSQPPSGNGFGDSAWNVSAGGTDLSDQYQSANYALTPSTTWWNTANSPGYESAVGYVPETAWAGRCSDPLLVSYLQYEGDTTYGTSYTPQAICSATTSSGGNPLRVTLGGNGGISTYTPLPSWQNVYGIGTNGTSSTYRNTPDLSLYAAYDTWNHALPFCESDKEACTYANYDSATSVLITGGTSFVAPQLAGFMALVAQKTGAAQGQANYTFYRLAAAQYGTTGSPAANIANCSGSKLAGGAQPDPTCIFHDISNDVPSLQGGTITPNNSEPCQVKTGNTINQYCYSTGGAFGISTIPGTTPSATTIAYQAGPGYDNVTGLGSFNFTNLVNAWNTVAPGYATTTALASSTSTVAANKGFTLTATVTDAARGSQMIPASSVTFNVSGSANSLGTAPIVSTCSGTNDNTTCTSTAFLNLEGSVLASGNNSITATFSGDGANDAASTSAPVNVSNTTDVTATSVVANPGSVAPGGSTTLTATVTDTTNPATTPVGQVTFYDITGSRTTAIAAKVLMNNGQATVSYAPQTSGSQTIQATFTPNDTGAFYTSSGTTSLVVDTLGSLTITNLPPSVARGNANRATVNAVGASGAIFTGFTGTVTLTSSDPAATFSPATYTYTSADAGSHDFTVTFNTYGTYSLTATSGSVSGSETGILVGNTTWAVSNLGELARLRADGTSLNTTETFGTAQAQFGGTAFDAAGHSFTVINTANFFARYSTTGNSPAVFSGGGLAAPTGIAVDGAGSLWIANSSGNSVSEFTNAGTAVSGSNGFATASVTAPSAVAIDSTGGVWVANRSAGTVTHLLGAATPVITPLSTATANGTLGVAP